MKVYPTFSMKQALKEAKEIEEMFEQTYYYPCLVEAQKLPAIHSIEIGDEGIYISTHNHSTYQATSPQELAKILEAIQVLEDYLYV